MRRKTAMAVTPTKIAEHHAHDDKHPATPDILGTRRAYVNRKLKPIEARRGWSHGRNALFLLAGVMLGMSLRGFIGVILGMHGMALRNLRVMVALFWPLPFHISACWRLPYDSQRPFREAEAAGMAGDARFRRQAGCPSRIMLEFNDAAPCGTYPIMRRGLTIGVEGATPSPGRAPPRRASQGSGEAVEKLELENT